MVATNFQVVATNFFGGIKMVATNSIVTVPVVATNFFLPGLKPKN